MAEQYGLSATGFKRKRLPEIQQSLRDRITDKLGLSIETGANSVLGEIIDIYAYELADLWELAENVYNAMYPSTASGTSLSNAAGLAGIYQITAEHTQATISCFGKEGTIIYKGKQIASKDNSDMIFSCVANAEITSGNANQGVVSVPSVSTGKSYGIIYNGTEYAYKAVSGDTKTAVLQKLAKLLLASHSDIMATVADENLTIAKTDLRDSFAIAVENLTLDSFATPILFASDEAGSISPAIGELTEIVTAVTGWDSAKNEIAAVVGRDDETDTALRQRWSSAVYRNSLAMIDSIREAVYEVTGVNKVFVFENDSDFTDELGRPPHSIEVIADGGADLDIANTIWKTKAAGIDTYGDVAKRVTDSSGISHTIRFNRPQEVKVWLKAVVGENPDEHFPTIGLQNIKTLLLEHGETQAVGEDVILQKYLAPIYSNVTGVGYVLLTATTGDTPGTYSSDNISITDRQIAVFDAERIEVMHA